MPSEQNIEQQQRLLAAHRQTLAHELHRLAMYGSAYAPPAIIHGIREAREGIAKAKATLRAWGVAVEDLPDDAAEAAFDHATVARTDDTTGRARAEQLLQAAAPQVEPAQYEAMVRRLANLLAGDATPDQLRELLLTDPMLASLLTSLAGREVQTGRAVLSFGEGSQLGDVQIRDVIGGNSTTVNLYFDTSRTAPTFIAPPSELDRPPPRPPEAHPYPDATLPLLRASDERLLAARSFAVTRRWVEAVAAYESLAAQYRLPERDSRLFAQAQREAWIASQIAVAEQAEARADWVAAITAWAALATAYPEHPTAAERHRRALAEQPLSELAQDAADFAAHGAWEAVLAVLHDLEQQRPGYTHPQLDLAALHEQALAGHAYAQALDQAEAQQWVAVIATLQAVPPTTAHDAIRELLAHAEAEVAAQQRAALRQRVGPSLDLIQQGAYQQAIDELADRIAADPADRASADVLAQIVETPAAPFAQRLRAAELVGRVGDPRIPVTLTQWQAELDRRNEKFGQPVGYWCFVRGGTYQIGGWDNDQATDVALKPFWIARYPLTVAQYAPFVEVGYGAEAERWWPAQGWQWKEQRKRTGPWGWDDADYRGSNQPVIGLTWYEATAYCVWLTTQVSLPKGYVIRLLTEAEWEAAATYDAQRQRRPYPWGEQEPTPELAISDASKRDRPAPVGCCPAGAAACGAMDLAGNVWEWATSRFAAYPAQSQRVETGFAVRDGDVPFRGGSWYHDSSYVRCGARVRLHPDYAYSDVRWGMRVCVAPELAH